MKYINNILKGVLALALVAMAATSCQPDEPEQVIEPIFPTLIEAEVEAGETFKFSIEPNMDWKLAIPSEQSAHFKLLLDNGKQDLVQRGKAGKHEISVIVADQTDLNNSYICEISLTMGGKTEVVAKLTKGKIERRAEVYTAIYSQETVAFEQDENGKWLYNSTPTTALDMVGIDDNSSWVQRIKIETNFDWTLRNLPSWMLTDEIVSGKAGATDIFIRVDDSRWPLEKSSHTMELCDASSDNNGDGVINGDDVVIVSQLSIELEGCKDVLIWDKLGSVLNINTDGLIYNSTAYDYVESVHGNIDAPYGVEIFKLNYYNNRYWAAETYSEWAKVTIGDYPSEATRDAGVWSRSVTISAEAYTYATYRECKILAMPANVAAAITDNSQLVLSDNSDIVEEYKQYVVCTLHQVGTSEDIQKAVAPVSADEMMASGGYFEELTAGTAPWEGKWANIPNGYRLTYNSNKAGSDLLFANPFASYEIYGPQGTKYDTESCWIAIERSEFTKSDENLYRIVMRLKQQGDEESEGYINSQPTANGGNEATFIFYDASGTAFALLHCILDTAFDPYSKIDTPVKFADPKAAYEAGAQLERIKPGEESYDSDNAARGVAQFRLICNPACKSINLIVPTFSTTHDGYTQNKGYITATQVSSTEVNITIKDEATESFNGRVSLYSSTASLSGSSDVAHIEVCYEVK